MLEGKEVDIKFDGEAGQAFVDVDAQGGVVLAIGYNKEIDLAGMAKITAKNEVKAETNIFTIAEKIAAKTGTPVDDMFVAGLKKLLGIQK
jgi:hypothetical protein